LPCSSRTALVLPLTGAAAATAPPKPPLARSSSSHSRSTFLRTRRGRGAVLLLRLPGIVPMMIGHRAPPKAAAAALQTRSPKSTTCCCPLIASHRGPSAECVQLPGVCGCRVRAARSSWHCTGEARRRATCTSRTHRCGRYGHFLATAWAAGWLPRIRRAAAMYRMRAAVPLPLPLLARWLHGGPLTLRDRGRAIVATHPDRGCSSFAHQSTGTGPAQHRVSTPLMRRIAKF
jgi:hypothetical protein